MGSHAVRETGPDLAGEDAATGMRQSGDADEDADLPRGGTAEEVVPAWSPEGSPEHGAPAGDADEDAAQASCEASSGPAGEDETGSPSPGLPDSGIVREPLTRNDCGDCAIAGEPPRVRRRLAEAPLQDSLEVDDGMEVSQTDDEALAPLAGSPTLGKRGREEEGDSEAEARRVRPRMAGESLDDDTQDAQPLAGTGEPSTGPLRACPSPARLSEEPSELGGADGPEDGDEDGNGGFADGYCRGASAPLSLEDGLEAVPSRVPDGDFREAGDDSMPL